MELNRRHLLAALSALGLAGASAQAKPVKSPFKKIGVQLYTVRDAFAKDPVGTLKRVKALGYDQVETIAFGGFSAADFKARLNDVGLTAPSGHVGLTDWQTRAEAALDDQVAVGARYAVLAWLPTEDRDGWKAWADKMNAWGQLAKARGLTFCYHNHDFEFKKTASGEIPYHLLLENTDPSLVAFELDCYWASFAGHDPVHVLKEHGSRIRQLHLKDKLADGSMAPVGEGTIDFAAVLNTAVKSGVENVYVEHDNPTDPWASIATSIKNLKG
ncbi:sugar phosphate isomerase/epimerase [Asticcacaulis sp. 201]|uniref:sugar phosphate isomerase/epimerase family protein n=1 Tax=Asticcacaulis sp. 201 TaxID=3028787 RepID=UPI002915E4C3|nr:sugar phosphate isomerase/epimerase [Asticcacaulis sp. 201]MDV6332236.1 sugar phosphate isomerase/epimerase [Asticcacaulis sp. 201]